MGYRLEFYNPNQHDEFIPDCGGKLFGYIENDVPGELSLGTLLFYSSVYSSRSPG